jgi:hypothetical protein
MSSCVSLAGFEEGRSVGEEATSITGSISTTQSPDFSEEDIDFTGIPFFVLGELSVKHGFTDKFDVGMRINSFFNVGVNAKYQVVGDKQSKFAMSLGTEFNSFAFTRIFNAHLPVFMSYYPKDNITINLAPRFVYQFGGIGNDSGEGITYFGGNTGIMFGKKQKIGFDFGLHRLYTPGNERIRMINIGVGAKLVFGGIDKAIKNEKKRR